MNQKQIEASELINQINELAEKLSVLIDSDSENLLGYTITLATSVLDDDGTLDSKSIISGQSLEIASVQTNIMFDNNDYFTTMCYAMLKAHKLKQAYVDELLNKATNQN